MKLIKRNKKGDLEMDQLGKLILGLILLVLLIVIVSVVIRGEFSAQEDSIFEAFNVFS